MTVTALAPLPTLKVEDASLKVDDFSCSEEEAATVTYAVDEGTVTVTAPALPFSTDDVVPLPAPVAIDELPVASAVDPASLVPDPTLELCPGTLPKTSTTLLLAKHPICTPLVVFSGMAAQTSPLLHPVISHLPSSVQAAYSASIQLYWPTLHDEEVVRLVNSSLSAFAWARLLA